MYQTIINGGASVLTGLALSTGISATNSGLSESDLLHKYNRKPLITNNIYDTGFRDASHNATFTLGYFDKLIILNDLAENITTNSIPLTPEQHKLLSDNLLDLL